MQVAHLRYNLGMTKHPRITVTVTSQELADLRQDRIGQESDCNLIRRKLGLPALLQGGWQNRDPSKPSPTRLGKLLGVSRQRAHQIINPISHYARIAVRDALKSGKIIKPANCERCQTQTQDLEGHHDDYHKPLDIHWLCVSCHGLTHRKANEQRTASISNP